MINSSKHINVSNYPSINLHSSCINHEGNEDRTKMHKCSEYMLSHVSATCFIVNKIINVSTNQLDAYICVTQTEAIFTSPVYVWVHIEAFSYASGSTIKTSTVSLGWCNG